MSDGKAIHRPSDDPIKTIRSLRFNTNLRLNEQYTQNVKDAQSWMTSSDAALSDVSSVMIRVKELTVKSGGSLDETGYGAIAAEIDGIINHLVQVGNTKIGDRYIFSGQMDKTMPFERITNSSGQDVVVYRGDTNKISMPIRPGEANPDQDSVNLTGDEIFGPLVVDADGNQTLDVFNHLISIKEELQKTPPDVSELTGDLLGFVDSDHTQLLTAQTRLGVRMSQYEMTENLMQTDYITITGDIAANEDIDMAKAIIQFNTSDNIYNAALAVGAKILPHSLVDFLR